MKTLNLIIITLLVAGFSFGEKEKSKPSLPQAKEIEKTKPKLSENKRKPFPPHWGKPPALQVRDYRPLPGGFGMGSSTLAKWIAENIKADKEGRKPRPRPEPIEEIKIKVNAMKLLQNELHLARKVLQENLKNKNKEEVADLIKSFKESQKERHEQIKAAKKELAREVRNRVQTKDRRE